ncbi:hypothetical protein ASZ90_016799 [hydrocarbon metagenome]|uniref:Uncharacterized protein n=1 Tax=hydrocarbon metagenome TaxID=938273 RepID=A0A0W8EAU3_9ZZZZ
MYQKTGHFTLAFPTQPLSGKLTPGGILRDISPSVSILTLIIR